MAIRINGTEKPSALRTYNEAAGTYRLGSNPNLYEIQRTNNFEFQIAASQFDGITSVGGKTFGSLSDGSSGPSDIVRISVQASAVPHFTQGQLEVKRGNNTIKYAGVPTFDTHKISVYDYIGTQAKEVLMAWQGLSYNTKTQKVGLASDYKKDCYLVEYTPDWQEVRRWAIHGAWVSGLEEDDFNSESNDVHKINVTITYDWAELEE